MFSFSRVRCVFFVQIHDFKLFFVNIFSLEIPRRSSREYREQSVSCWSCIYSDLYEKFWANQTPDQMNVNSILIFVSIKMKTLDYLGRSRSLKHKKGYFFLEFISKNKFESIFTFSSTSVLMRANRIVAIEVCCHHIHKNVILRYICFCHRFRLLTTINPSHMAFEIRVSQNLFLYLGIWCYCLGFVFNMPPIIINIVWKF